MHKFNHVCHRNINRKKLARYLALFQDDRNFLKIIRNIKKKVITYAEKSLPMQKKSLPMQKSLFPPRDIPAAHSTGSLPMLQPVSFICRYIRGYLQSL